MTDPDYQHLLDEARIEDRRCPGSGRGFALFAGIRAREIGEDNTANPFDSADEPELFAAWADGHRMQRHAPIPLAPVVPFCGGHTPGVSITSPTATTFAARVHDALES